MSPTAGAFATTFGLVLVAVLCCVIEIPRIERALEEAAVLAAGELGIAEEAVTAEAVGNNVEIRLEGATQEQAQRVREAVRKRTPIAQLVDVEPTGVPRSRIGADDTAGGSGAGLERLQSDVDTLVRERRISFEMGTAELTEDSRATLDELADLLRSRGLSLRVEGHTDASGDAAANLQLSRLRAESVVAYLSSVGLEHNRMEPVGLGDTRPIADNRSPEGRQQNRRVEFRLDRGARP